MTDHEGNGSDPGSRALPRVSIPTRLSATTEAIRRHVLSGLPTSARLKDQELAEALGVSRATVREAVRELVHDGILIHEPYKGLRVATLDDQGWLDLAEVRAALEIAAARRLSEAFTPAIEAQLVDGLRRIAQARASGSVGEQVEAHLAFHTLMQQLAGNPILQKTWAVIEKRARVMVRVDLEEDPDVDRVATHSQLVEAIRTGDADIVVRAVTDHVMGNARLEVDARRRRRQEAAEDGQPR